MIEAKPCFPIQSRDNEPSLYHPSANVNARLKMPAYQRFERNHPRFFTAEQKSIALARQDFTCPICGQGVGMHDSECHHMVQWRRGGSSSLDNLLVVHRGSCHEMADARALANDDMIIGGTIYQAEPSQMRTFMVNVQKQLTEVSRYLSLPKPR